jgi:hypothetical protein
VGPVAAKIEKFRCSVTLCLDTHDFCISVSDPWLVQWKGLYQQCLSDVGKVSVKWSWFVAHSNGKELEKGNIEC